jgi:hypothetical protein
MGIPPSINLVPVSLSPAKSPLVRFGIAVTDVHRTVHLAMTGPYYYLVSDELGRRTYGKYFLLIRIPSSPAVPLDHRRPAN